jgi:uncharacterized protein (TIGR03437 family)
MPIFLLKNNKGPMRLKHATRFACILAGSALLAANLCAQGYTFTKLVDTGAASPFGEVAALAISPTGTVLFIAREKDGKTALFTLAGSTRTRVIDDTGDLLNVYSGAINSNGRIAISAQLDDRSTALRIIDQGAVKTVYTSNNVGAAELALGATIPKINESGTVAFNTGAAYGQAAQYSPKIILSDGTTQVPVADYASNLAGFNTVGNVDINKRSQVAFVATKPTGGGLYLFSDNKFQLIIGNTAFGITFFAAGIDPPSLNDSGAIAFQAMSDSFESGIWLYQPSMQARPVLTDTLGSHRYSSWRAPMLNNQATVAFSAVTQADSRHVMYTSTNGVLSKVIADGDPLFGSTLGAFDRAHTRGRYLDDSGRLVFDYTLQNGETGLAMALPPGVTLPASATQPTLTPNSVANGATYLPGGLVPGSWAQVKGVNLAGTTRIWQDSDFTQLPALPKSLSGVEVKVNGVAAAVYFISPTQVTFQVPDTAPGPATVQVIRDGNASETVGATVVARAPGIFPLTIGGKNFAAGVFLDGKITGDPAAATGFRKARPGDVIQLFVTGLETVQAGVVPSSRPVPGVVVKLGTVSIPAAAAALTGVGLFQVNFIVPADFATLPAGDYPVTVEVGGVASPLNVNTSPPSPVVIPVEH